jgi:carbon-monoxide dehydrogenase small subunit
MKVNFILNGVAKSYDVPCGEFLLDTLRKNQVHSVRRGCDSTSCGICTVLFDGKPVPSCSVLSVRAEGHQITTVEGIAEEAEKLSRFFGKEGADQCGFCNPSLALVVYALKQENHHPSEKDVIQYLAGNLCRCSGYKSQQKAIMAYLEDRA